MSKADVCAVILCAGATLYAIFGGADFGAGVWQLLHARARAGSASGSRHRIDYSLGPGLGGQPRLADLLPRRALDRVPRRLRADHGDALPAARAGGARDRPARVGLRLRPRLHRQGADDRAEIVFALSSLITPFFMGCVVGAIASGEVVPAAPTERVLGLGRPAADRWSALLFVVSCAYIAVGLPARRLPARRRRGAHRLVPARRDPRRRGRRRCCAVGRHLRSDADAALVFDGLSREGLPLVIASPLLGGVALVWPRPRPAARAAPARGRRLRDADLGLGRRPVPLPAAPETPR